MDGFGGCSGAVACATDETQLRCDVRLNRTLLVLMREEEETRWRIGTHSLLCCAICFFV